MTRLLTPLGATLVLLTLAGGPLRADPREVRTLEAAADAVRALGEVPFRGIPRSLLHDAAGVAVIPHVVKAGLFVDARFGRGVVLARRPDGTWSNPIFITLAGSGLGFQAGVESTDVVLVFRTPASLGRILRGKGKLTLGADASVAAGPLGREAEAATDARLRAEIYSYSRSRGLFAGVSLEGAGLLIDHRANADFYRLRGCRPEDVLALRHEVAEAQALKWQLARLSGALDAAPVLVPATPVPVPVFPPQTPPPPLTTPRGP
jgi:lipid-binding SYLF domain-containing protein